MMESYVCINMYVQLKIRPAHARNYSMVKLQVSLTLQHIEIHAHTQYIIENRKACTFYMLCASMVYKYVHIIRYFAVYIKKYSQIRKFTKCFRLFNTKFKNFSLVEKSYFSYNIQQRLWFINKYYLKIFSSIRRQFKDFLAIFLWYDMCQTENSCQCSVI